MCKICAKIRFDQLFSCRKLKNYLLSAGSKSKLTTPTYVSKEAQSRQSTKFFSSRLKWDSPNPLTRWRERGWGFRRRDIHCVVHMCIAMVRDWYLADNTLYAEYQSICPIVGIGFPHPQASVALPPFGSKVRDTLACGWGSVAGPNSEEGTDTLVLYVYYNHSTNTTE
jgi:hypothetical protein